MQFGVLSKLTQPQGRVICPIEAPAPAGVGTEFDGLVIGRIVLTNTGAVISARGHLSAVAICECARCLEKHRVPLEIEVNEECSLSQIDEPQAPEEDDVPPIPILDADVVDLTELVRQALVVNVPPWSVCRPDCQGICPECGANLNRTPCSCSRSGTSPWEQLRDLLDDG